MIPYTGALYLVQLRVWFVSLNFAVNTEIGCWTPLLTITMYMHVDCTVIVSSVSGNDKGWERWRKKTKPPPHLPTPHPPHPAPTPEERKKAENLNCRTSLCICKMSKWVLLWGPHPCSVPLPLSPAYTAFPIAVCLFYHRSCPAMCYF